MKPYFQTDLGSLYHGDCLEVMKGMSDKSVDLVLTDPPYGIGCDGGTYGYGVSPNTYEKMNWDNKRVDGLWLIHVFRISNKQIIFGGNYYADLLPITKSWIVWDKVGHYVLKNPFSKVELIWTNLKIPTDKITFVQ